MVPEVTALSENQIHGSRDVPLKADPARRLRHLTALATLAKGAVWILVGRIVPMLVAFLLTPPLVALLGINRWGLLSLSLSLITMFSLLDMGIGRCVTRALAPAVAGGREAEAAGAAWAGLLLLLSIGATGSVIASFFVHDLVYHVLAMPAAVMAEAESAIRVLLLAGPLLLANIGLAAILAAFQAYRGYNLLSLVVSVGQYVGMLMCLHMWNNLAVVVGLLVGCRLTMTVGLSILCVSTMPSLVSRTRIDMETVRTTLFLGGWMTASNLLNTCFFYLDRFLIGAVLSISATTFYMTPLDLVVRLTIVPVAVCSALFTGVSASVHIDEKATLSLLRRGAIATAAILFPICALLVAFADEFMGKWLGNDFAVESGPVLAIFSIGILFAAIGHVPDTLIDGAGRSRLTAQFGLLQLIVYIPILYCAVKLAGISGAALAWTLRSMVDCCGRYMIAVKVLPSLREPAKRVITILLLSAVMMAVPWTIGNALMRAQVWVGEMVLFGFMGWVWLAHSDDRIAIRTKLRDMLTRVGVISAVS